MDKRDLLAQLRIDRDEDLSPASARPLKWFLLIAAVTGVAFVAWFVKLPGETTLVVPTTVTPEIMILGLVWAVLLGIVGGLFPAVRAARLPITAALRRG